MNKLALALFFLVIAFIKGAVDNYNTEPYYSFDWLDKDDDTYKITFTDADATVKTYFSYLYNNSKVCVPKCEAEGKTLSCKLKGSDCGGDPDNPTYKYYYSAYYAVSSSTFNESMTADKIKELVDGGSGGTDAYVTVAVCDGSFLKYSMILLSLLIL
jgi:hypothetical protein